MSIIPKFARKNTPVILLALLACAPWIAAADDAPASGSDQEKNDAYRAAVAQESLKKDVASIQAKLAAVREEMKDLLPQDATMVDRAFKQLESLSQTDINAAIDSLHAASRTQDVKEQLQKLSDAFQKQTAITSDLKHISVDLTARQVRDEVTQKLIEILKHQVAARDEVGRVAQANPGVPPSKLHGAMDRRYEVVIGDQSAITDDLNIIMKRIADAATTLPPDARAFMVNANTIMMQQRLQASANDALNFTRYGPFDHALYSQNANIGTLLMIVQTLDSDQKVVEQLKELSTELAQVEKDQKALAADMAKDKGNTPSYEEQKRQIDISDRTAALSAELQAINAKAAALVRVGQADMENAVGIASAGRHEDQSAIAPEQQKADGFLNNAQQAVSQQLAQLTAAEQQPAAESEAQKAAVADTLLRDVRQAANQEGGVAVTATQMPNSTFMPTLSQQQAFHEQVDTLQTRALPVSPEAAAAIGDASSQLTTAATALDQSQIATAHQTAAADLARAADILAQQKLAADQKKKEDDAGTQAEQKMDSATQKTATAQPELNSSSSSASAVNQLASAQADVNSAQQDAAAAGADPSAQASLAQANSDLAAAQTDAATLQLSKAQADAKAAAAALAAAKSSMQASAAAAAAAKGQSGQTTAQAAKGQQSNMGGGQTGPGELFTGHGDWNGPVQVVSGLTPHDQAAVTQLQGEKPPGAYVPQVQQYYKNLADGAGQ